MPGVVDVALPLLPHVCREEVGVGSVLIHATLPYFDCPTE